MSRFIKLTDEGVKEAFEKQRKDVGWTFYDEREFVENIFCQRFNFLLIVYSLFITAVATADTPIAKISILFVGVVFTGVLGLVIYRAYIKLIILLKILHSLEGHVFSTIEIELNAFGKKAFRKVNHYMGIYIPLFCTLTLVLALVYNLIFFLCKAL